MLRRVTGFLAMLCAFLMISVGLLPWAPAKTYALGFKVYADDSGVRIVSGEPLLGMDNMAPGDVFVTDLEVDNNSPATFVLAISSEVVEESSSQLYEKLQVKISGDGVIYSGPLSNLHNISLGSFSAGSSSGLLFEFKLPTDAGNEFHGLSVSIRFAMTQRPEDSAPPSDDDSADPTTPANPPEEPGPEPVLPIIGTNQNLFLPLGLILFLLGLVLLRSAGKEYT